MALYITDVCTSCGKCEPLCPNEAISQAADIYVIDPDKCQECQGVYDSPRCASVCPVHCCVKVKEG